MAIAKPTYSQRAREAWRYLGQGSTDHRILAAVLTISFLTGITRVAALFKELAVAWRFGTGDAVEAYIIAYLIPTLGTTVIANSINVSLIPTYIRVREQESPLAAQKLLSSVTVWVLVLLSVVAVGIIAVARFYLPLLASGFNANKLSLTLTLTYVLAPTMVLSGIGNIWGAVLNAGERFALVALAPIITPLVTLGLVLFATDWGVFALAGGILIGSLLELAALGVALRLAGIRLRPRWHGFDAPVKEVANQFRHRVGASALRGGSNVVSRSLAAMLPAGSVAALNFGSKITTAVLAMAGAALGSAVTPYFSKMVARKEWSALRQTLRRYFVGVFIATVPVTVGLFFLSRPIIRIVYERGSFNSSDTILVSAIQALFVLQIPFAVATVLVGRLLATFLAANILMRAAAINLVINLSLNILFMKLMGVAGLALSTSCAVALTFLYLARHAMRFFNAHALSPTES